MYGESYLPDLPPLQWSRVLRDPIWGEVPITEVEARILRTSAFARLRRIRQLSFAYLDFPGAVHSRFEHSIGVMHATDKLLEKVSQTADRGPSMDSFARQLFRLSALLHDIGHPPFSHAIEGLFSFYPGLLPSAGSPDTEVAEFLSSRDYEATDLANHETWTEYIICTDQGISAVLADWLAEELGRGYIPGGERRLPAIKRTIASVAVGRSPEADDLTAKLRPLAVLFKSIMSGDIDADKIDYLMRDNYFCGLPYDLDLASLRGCLVPRTSGLELKPEAKKFVHSLVLARFRLITEVHHGEWNVLATAMAIERLHAKLKKSSNPYQKIEDIFLNWTDSNLLSYLEASASDPDDEPFQRVLRADYPIAEVARLDFLETHPHIRECVQVLSDPVGHKHIPKLQRYLREDTGEPELWVHIQSVKTPEFSMRWSGTGDLLRDEIIRGISEESIKNLHLLVYGRKRTEGEPALTVSLEKVKQDSVERLPCEDCPIGKTCPDNLASPIKKYLANLAVERYRAISAECGESAILPVDFLLLIMERIDDLILGQRQGEGGAEQGGPGLQPIRQDIYRIAKKVAGELPSLQFHGRLDLEPDEISSGFYQEIRKYEQLGLIAFSREIRRLESERGEDSAKKVFRFDRRFRLSKYGSFRLDKVRRVAEGERVREYRQYVRTWRRISSALDRLDRENWEILWNGAAIEETQAVEPGGTSVS